MKNYVRSGSDYVGRINNKGQAAAMRAKSSMLDRSEEGYSSYD
jgi:hypothetical protein